MDEHVEFDAVLSPLEWGRNVYTVVLVPRDLVERARAEGTHRLDGHLDDEPVNVGLARADVLPDTFFYIGKALQRRLRAAPGSVVRCRLRPIDPEVVPLADDVRAALTDAGVSDIFAALPAARRRRLLAPIDGVTGAAARMRRIQALAQELAP